MLDVNSDPASKKSILNNEINITGIIKVTKMETFHPMMILDQGTRMFSAVGNVITKRSVLNYKQAINNKKLKTG